ncbi:MAG: SMP-30/gluconolactonase/LRE family protein [Thermoanaerobaculia bacterium]
MQLKHQAQDRLQVRRDSGLLLTVGLLAALVLQAVPCEAQSYTWTHLAGSTGGAGYDDGPGATAQLSGPQGVARDAAGNTYVADTYNHTIRKIDAAGNVTTLAGLAGAPGFADGKGGAARFRYPSGVAVDASGNVFVADSQNNRIRKIDTAGNMSTLAGNGTQGFADGPGASAMFSYPFGVAVDASGNVYVGDPGNQRIRKIDIAGNVSTLAGTGTQGFADGSGASAILSYPYGVAVDASGNVYFADTYNNRIRKIDTSGNVSTLAGTGTQGFADGPGASAMFTYPGGVAVDASGSVYVADSQNNRIRKIDTSGNVSTLAGNGNRGLADGPGASAMFTYLYGVAVDASGNVYVADRDNGLIRKIDTSSNVSTLAGSGNWGFADGPGASARFANPWSVAVDASGNVYVGDSDNRRIRKIDTAGNVSTLAGSGTYGFADGPGATARFTYPYGVAVDASGNVYVADVVSNRIRKIDTAGNVSTLAGNGTSGFADGPGASAMFRYPEGVAVDSAGNVYVGDYGNRRIRKIDTSGNVSTLAGSGSYGFADGPGASAMFSSPAGVAVDASGNVYVADSENSRIRKIDTAGNVSTLAGNGGRGFSDGPGASAWFDYPYGVAVDASGNVYVADSHNRRIRKIDTAGNVTTLGGSNAEGSADGTGAAASFSLPAGICIDPHRGRIIVADGNNNAIRVGEAALPDVATIDQGTGPTYAARQLDTSPQTATTWKWELVRRPTGSVAQLSSTTVRNPTFTPDVADVYVFRLTAKDAADVTSGTLVTLVATPCAPPVPTITRTAGSNPSCPGASLTLDAGAGFTSYLWSTGATTRTITVTSAATTTYTVRVTAGGCPELSPAASYQQVVGVLSTVTLAPAMSQTLCATGTGATLTAVANGGGASAYQWGYRTVTGGAVTPIGGQTGASYQINGSHFPGAGSYYVVCTVTPTCGSVTTSSEARVQVATCAPIASSLTFRHLAGSTGGAGYDDGPGATAQLSSPQGVARDTAGNTYVADTSNHTIRKIDAAGNVTTLAGLAGAPGFADGKGGAARFRYPYGVAVDASSNVFVADSSNQRIRKIDTAGNVSTVAGNGTYGFADGPGASAMFRNPYGVAVDSSGDLYVVDTSNHRIRRIDTAGNVSTLAGNGTADFFDGPGASAMFSYPRGVAVDASGNVYVADRDNHRIRKLDTAGNVSTLAGNGTEDFADGLGASAMFSSPGGVAVDASGDVYVADTYNRRIRKIDTAGNVSTVAGNGTYGFADGPGASAMFRNTYGVAVDAAGNVSVADSGNQRIRRIDTAGNVSTLAGNGDSGYSDGPSASARFAYPWGVAVDASGNAYVGDSENRRIRKIDTAGNVSTLAGSGGYGFADGPGASAMFTYPYGVAVDAAGNVYVADVVNNRIRKIDTAGNVSTLAGNGTSGFADGPGASAMFSYPYGVAVDDAGNVFVADGGNGRIRKIDTAGNVSTLAGNGTSGFADGPGASAMFSSPEGVAVDASGNVYVADVVNNRIRKIDTAGDVTTLGGMQAAGIADGPGASAMFGYPRGVAVDASGNVYVADPNNQRIRKIDTAGDVTTLGGMQAAGSADGTGAAANFYYPTGICIDPYRGRIIVADSNNNAIRVGEAALPDVATIDQATGPTFVTRQLNTSPQTATTWEWGLVRRPTGSVAQLSSTTVSNPTFTPDVADVYVFRLTAKDSAGVMSGTLVTLTATPCIPPAPPTAGSNSPVTAGGTIALTASTVAGATYSWTGPNGFTSALQNPTITNADAQHAGTYSVIVTVGGCPSPAATTNVTVLLGQTLTVTRNGTGTGSVFSSPLGVNCGATCNASYPIGTVVTLTPVANPGATFTGWSGACTGTGACSVTMSAARSVNATFALAPVLPQITSFTATPAVRTSAGASTLAWTTTGATSVAISGLGGTFALSGTRDVSVAATTTYTLTATNAAGSVTATATVNVLPGAGTSLGTPVITAPTAGQTVAVAGVGFTWNAVASAAGYDVKLYSATSGATVFAGSLVGNASTSTLVTLPDGAYLFAVRACNASGFANANCGAFATRSFSVAKTAPTGAPTVTAPAQGAVLTASTQTFSWTAVPSVDPGLSLSYEVLLTDVAGGNIPDLQITVPDPTLSTIYTLHSSALYELKVRACQAGCGPWSAPVTFSVDLPDVPTTAPSVPTCSVSGGNSLTCSWSAVTGADVYSFYVVQPTGGPGGGALTVAARLVSESTVTLPVPQGFANVIVAACTGDGCGPYSGARGINPSGPDPGLPNLGTPLAASVVNGPGVEFAWNRIPGDDGTNTWYRLYVQDLSRQAAALDVYTHDNFYAAYFKAEGARYDALVVANHGASQIVGPPIGFNVRGLSASAPTMVSPPHQSQVQAGNLQLGWSPVPGATLYQYWVAVLGQGTPAVTGVTPGLVVQVPLPAVAGQPTNYSGITRACMSPTGCSPTSVTGWGQWSNAPGGPGVTNFTVVP